MAPPKGEKAPERARRLLIERMLNGTHPPGSTLPGERALAKEIGVARPALREALQGLARNGWISVQHGKPTQVNHFMRDGNLNVLIDLLQADINLLPGFVPNLLEMWSLVAPTYTRRAVEADGQAIADLLAGFRGLDDRPAPYVRAQWRLHRTLIDLGGNPVYGLMLNSFGDFYARLAQHYLADPARRAAACDFWEELRQAALSGDAGRAASAMQRYMDGIRAQWAQLNVSEWVSEAGQGGEMLPRLDEDERER